MLLVKNVESITYDNSSLFHKRSLPEAIMFLRNMHPTTHKKYLELGQFDYGNQPPQEV
jgi:hypothetical protein